jgi:hypothetical protein
MAAPVAVTNRSASASAADTSLARRGLPRTAAATSAARATLRLATARPLRRQHRSGHPQDLADLDPPKGGDQVGNRSGHLSGRSVRGRIDFDPVTGGQDDRLVEFWVVSRPAVRAA